MYWNGVYMAERKLLNWLTLTWDVLKLTWIIKPNEPSAD